MLYVLQLVALKKKIHYLQVHQNCMTSTKVTTIFSFCQDQKQHPAVPTEGVSRGRSVTVAVGVSDRWYVTCDI